MALKQVINGYPFKFFHYKPNKVVILSDFPEEYSSLDGVQSLKEFHLFLDRGGFRSFEDFDNVVNTMNEGSVGVCVPTLSEEIELV